MKRIVFSLLMLTFLVCASGCNHKQEIIFNNTLYTLDKKYVLDDGNFIENKYIPKSNKSETKIIKAAINKRHKSPYREASYDSKMLKKIFENIDLTLDYNDKDNVAILCFYAEKNMRTELTVTKYYVDKKQGLCQIQYSQFYKIPSDKVAEEKQKFIQEISQMPHIKILE